MHDVAPEPRPGEDVQGSRLRTAAPALGVPLRANKAQEMHFRIPPGFSKTAEPGRKVRCYGYGYVFETQGPTRSPHTFSRFRFRSIGPLCFCILAAMCDGLTRVSFAFLGPFAPPSISLRAPRFPSVTFIVDEPSRRPAHTTPTATPTLDGHGLTANFGDRRPPL